MFSIRRPVEGAETDDGQLSWSPQLDLRNFGVDMIRIAVRRLAESAWAPWFAEYVRLAGLEHADVGKAAASFCAAVAAWLADPATEPDPHLVAAGFYAAPLPCQLAVFAAVGEVALGHFAHAMRQSTRAADSPELPYQAALARLQAEGAAIALNLELPPTAQVDRLGLGLQLLRPYLAPKGRVDRLKSGGIGVDCGRAVPAAVVARLKGLGWYDDYDAGTPGAFTCWKFML